MRIIDLIKSALDLTGLEPHFITRGNNKPPCVVYNYISTPSKYSDNNVDTFKYTVLINLLVFSNIEDTKEQVYKAMISKGFKAKPMEKTMIEDGGLYNTPMQFNISLQKESN